MVYGPGVSPKKPVSTCRRNRWPIPNGWKRPPRQARQLVTQLAPRLRDYLNGLYGTQHDDRYWDFVLAPWLVRAVETLIDRLYRAAGILDTFGGRLLSVPVLDASEFAFADTQDFIMGGILNRSGTTGCFPAC